MDFLKVWSYLHLIGATFKLGCHEQISIIKGEKLIPNDWVNYVRIFTLCEKRQTLMMQLPNPTAYFNVWHKQQQWYVTVMNPQGLAPVNTT